MTRNPEGNSRLHKSGDEEFTSGSRRDDESLRRKLGKGFLRET